MAERKQAIMVGALEAIGRYIVERLRKQKHAAEPRHATATSVSICSTMRPRPRSSPAWRKRHTYVAFQPAAGAAAGYASNIAPNRDIP